VTVNRKGIATLVFEINSHWRKFEEHYTVT
jgi:hypothetical protein